MTPGGPLPRRAEWLVAGTVALAAAVSAAAIAVDHTRLRPGAVVLLLVGILLGEALQIDLPYGRGGTARLSLNDTAIVAGLLLLSPRELLLAAFLGIALWQVLDRVRPVKALFNTAQYVLSSAAALLVVQVLAPRPGPLSPSTLVAVALGVGVFLTIQLVAVSSIIAATGGAHLTGAARRLAPSGGLMAAGNACLGLIAVLLVRDAPWALLALAFPVLLLHLATQQEVRARIDRERSATHGHAERRLAQASTPDEVATVLVESARAVLGCEAALWRQDAWVTPVPEGTRACPLREDAPVMIAGDYGPAAPSAAVGVGGGVLVVWGVGIRDAEEWLGRLGSAGRASFERAAQAAALAQEQATLRAVVDGTGDGILVLDRAGVVRLWNPAMAELAGVAAADAVGSGVESLLGGGPWAQPGVHDVEHAERVWRVSVAAVRDREQGVLHVAVVHDVTTERRVARMKDDMLAVVSHELRTPLTPIKASAQLLRRRWQRIDDSGREDLLEQIERRADHLTRLVEDLLLVGQLSAGRDTSPAVVQQDVDLASVLRDNVAQLALGRPARAIRVEAPATLPATTDAMRVRQIVDNLVDNACKFSPEGSPVTVRMTETDGWALLEVADRGRGIAPADVERVFERFERVEDPLVMTTSGAGLGLYIVRALVEALGGTIWLDSREGVGTTACVRLPLLRRPASIVA